MPDCSSRIRSSDHRFSAVRVHRDLSQFAQGELADVAEELYLLVDQVLNDPSGFFIGFVAVGALVHFKRYETLQFGAVSVSNPAPTQDRELTLFGIH